MTESDARINGDLVSAVLTVDPLAPSDSGSYSCSYKRNGEADYTPSVSVPITVYGMCIQYSLCIGLTAFSILY